MRIALTLILYLLVTTPLLAGQPDLESPWSRNQRGMEAYRAEDFAACAAILTELSRDPASRSATTRYNAACCQSLAGHPRKAVELLDEASEIDLLPVARVEDDADLAAVRALPEWPALRARLDERERSSRATMDSALRDELARRVALDQDIRRRAIEAGQPLPPALFEELVRIDSDNTAWAKQVLEEHGWPGSDLVGTDGSGSFFLLVQHADADPSFQKQALAQMEAAVERGQASAGQMAYLTDRILTGDDEAQRYGTQLRLVDGKIVPFPIEDAGNVDARRLQLGLPTMAEYIRLHERNLSRPAEQDDDQD